MFISIILKINFVYMVSEWLQQAKDSCPTSLMHNLFPHTNQDSEKA